jgi:hypothetical protein
VAYSQIGSISSLIASLRVIAVYLQISSSALANGDPRLGVDYITHDLVCHLFQYMAATDIHKPSAIAVGINISNGVLAQFLSMMFYPFCGTN